MKDCGICGKRILINYTKSQINMDDVNREPSPFEKELEKLINSHSVENLSNTPDFILAFYLNECLLAFGNAMIWRDQWYNNKFKELKTQDESKTKEKE
jgi:hypothetical protein